MKPLFVGMNNARGDEAFWPMPAGSAGERLWRLVNEAVGWDRETFLMRTDRVNFCTGPGFRDQDVNSRVEEIKSMMHGRATTILVGEVVCRLLDGPGEWLLVEEGVVAIPHTAGLNRFYNDKSNKARVVKMLREVLS